MGKIFGRVIYASETIQNCKNPTGHIDTLNAVIHTVVCFNHVHQHVLYERIDTSDENYVWHNMPWGCRISVTALYIFQISGLYDQSSNRAKKNLNSSLPFRQLALKFCLSWASLRLLFLWFSWQTTFLGPCPLGKWEWKVTCPTGKSTCPGQPDSTFFEPCPSYNKHFCQWHLSIGLVANLAIQLLPGSKF